MEKKIKAILVDDEANNRKVLRNLLVNFCPEVDICGEAADVEEAFLVIERENPDLVFLDIQMPTGNGFTLLKKYTVVPFDV
ncbi:MAG TPA: response regulator, partial [Nitrosopumilaceae archaeon]|nr:response regulator [Nitrosopumilaceae archaeon]